LATAIKPDKAQLDAERAKRALKITRAATAKAAKVAIDAERNISTRRRAALKIKADALDEVGLVLSGKDDAAKS
jgi:hypothetical protein